MYIGRIVAIARTQAGGWCAGYRVSSRSFPNRTAVLAESKVSIVPKPGHEGDVHKNPYIAYNCVRLAANGAVAVVTNGSQTDPIAEKIDAGMGVRDALALALIALDYEKDAYNTPRVCAVADSRGSGMGWLAVVRKNGLEVRGYPLELGRFQYAATYEENTLDNGQSGVFTATTAEEFCEFLLKGGVFAERTNPVTAVSAAPGPEGFHLAVRDV